MIATAAAVQSDSSVAAVPTGIEVLRTRIEGSVVVIECAFSINLSALTLEQACASQGLCIPRSRHRASLIPTAGVRRLRCWESGARWSSTCEHHITPLPHHHLC